MPLPVILYVDRATLVFFAPPYLRAEVIPGQFAYMADGPGKYLMGHPHPEAEP
jgi:hypothetical protein